MSTWEHITDYLDNLRILEMSYRFQTFHGNSIKVYVQYRTILKLRIESMSHIKILDPYIILFNQLKSFDFFWGEFGTSKIKF